MARKNHYQCFSQHRGDIAVYRRPSKGRSSLSLNEFVAYTTRHENKPTFLKGGKVVAVHKSGIQRLI